MSCFLEDESEMNDSAIGRAAAAEHPQPMVELRRVSKRFGGLTALADVDLQVARGEFLTLLGPSGSGKTTLLNMIAGMTPPTEGQVFINGRDATSLPPAERDLGMVFQNYALMPHMSVFDNIAFPLRVRKVPKGEIAERVQRALDLIRLPDVGRRKPRELSGGQQQRVSLARCIVYNPALILLDEPLGALDKKLREQMQLEIKRIHSELGITMINVTHDQDEALTLSDRIVLMNRGRIEQHCAPEELYFRPRTVFAADFMGEANLLEAEVTSATDTHVRLDWAHGALLAPRPTHTPERLQRGDRVVVLVRPECVSMGQGEAGDENRVAGRLRDSIVLGGVVKHYVTLPDGKELIVQQPNHVRRSAGFAGQDVHLAWQAHDALVLQAGGQPS